MGKLVSVSEARLNDLCYLALKRYFFEPMFGAGSCPRECDIRVCMDLVCRERISSPLAAVLLPDEVSGRSHSKFFMVDAGRVLSEVVGYMEGHWLKDSIEAAFKDEKVRGRIKRDWRKVAAVVLAMSEVECGG